MIPIDAIMSALRLLPPKMTSASALVLMITIGFQESRFLYRRQIRGPARGFWQFEDGGVKGVLEHPASAEFAKSICAQRGVAPAPRDVHVAIENDDVLAAAFARLLLWTDRRSMPTEPDRAWQYYVFNWRPGKPHRDTWDGFYAQAEKYVDELR